MCDKFNLTTITLNANNGKTFISHYKQCICSALIENQLRLIKTKRKLSFYTTVKEDTSTPDFLDMIKNPRHRIAMDKFRLGNHHLPDWDRQTKYIKDT